MSKQTIVIDREYGSGGREVARIISEKLGMEFYDGNLLVMASERFGINLGVMKDYDEKGVGSLLYNIAMAANYSSNYNYEKMEAPYRIYTAQAQVMKRLVAERPCIFLGRCADEILKDVTPVLSVFIFGTDMEKKKKRIANVDGIAGKGVDNYIHKKDAQRKSYYHYYTKKEWGNMRNYDMCLNTALLSYEEAADAIIGALKK